MSFDRCVVMFVLLLIVPVRNLRAQDIVSQARTLYEMADYEGALKVLAEVTPHGVTPAQLQTLREYRALSLLALERTDDVERTIQEMVDSDPLYRPAADVPPRLVSAYDRVRRRRLPSIIRQRLVRAKSDFEAQRFHESVEGFESILQLAKDVEDDLGSRIVRAEAERELAASRAELGRKSRPAVVNLCQMIDPAVVPPVPIQQPIPSWQPTGADGGPFQGEVELEIDASGSVREARITVPINPAYDRAIVAAARTWKYRPATKNGQPVDYCKVMTIGLAPRRTPGSVAPRR